MRADVASLPQSEVTSVCAGQARHIARVADGLRIGMRAAVASENSPVLISLSRVRATSMMGTKKLTVRVRVPNGALGARAHSFWLRIRSVLSREVARAKVL